MYSHGVFNRWRRHPWHGLQPRPDGAADNIVQAFIEMTPFDVVKYETDKITGFLKVDRPQRTTSHPPALYGFIPQTYCGKHVAALCDDADEADGDPLDICVLSERPINHSEIILNARVLGGLPMMDHGEADDKIIAMLDNDLIWEGVTDISELPEVLVERLRHYFSTYKLIPGEESLVTIDNTYGREHAMEVIQAAMADYQEEYGS